MAHFVVRRAHAPLIFLSQTTLSKRRRLLRALSKDATEMRIKENIN